MKLLQFFVITSLLAAPFCHAEELTFPVNKPATYTVTQKWSATGILDNLGIFENCTSAVDFQLVIKKSKSGELYADVTLKRVAFSVQTSEGIASEFNSDPDQLKNTNPEVLNAVLVPSLFLNVPLRFKLSPKLSEMKTNEPFMKYVVQLVQRSNNELVQDAFRASKGFWFLDEKYFKNVLTHILSNLDTRFESSVKKEGHYPIDIEPRLPIELFHPEFSDIAMNWFKNINKDKRPYLLYIREIDTNEIIGSWSGSNTFDIQGLPGKSLFQKTACKGTASWNKMNALIQNRSWTWEGDFRAELRNSKANIHFSFEEKIETSQRKE